MPSPLQAVLPPPLQQLSSPTEREDFRLAISLGSSKELIPARAKWVVDIEGPPFI
jgi:hypothetical protein